MARSTIVTHNGGFHADDVFAVATLLLHLKNQDITVVRTRDKDVIEKGDFVVDVGGVYDPKTNRFDHHQIGGAGERDSGIPYAAFGLVWKHFGEELSGGEETMLALDALLATPLDAIDNGIDLVSPLVGKVFPYEISDAVRAFLPTWEEKVSVDERFNQAVDFARTLLSREIVRVSAKRKGEQFTVSAYHASGDKRLVVLDVDYPWKEVLARFPEPIFVVHPEEGGWRLYCVRDNPKQFMNRKDLPEEWAGLRDEALAKVSGVSDAVFCHRNRFMAVARSRAGAVALAQRALEN